MVDDTVRAHAKIVGPGWIHYMMEPKCVMGRGPASVDVALTGDVSISRKHVQIEFSPELQAFEISVLGKNGIFVNGEFLRNGEQPRILRSHTDIIIGRSNPALVTFYLPRLPFDKSTKINGNGKRLNGNSAGSPNMVTMVGTLLISSDVPLNAEQIYGRLVSTQVRILETLGTKKVIEASIRSAIACNPHLFETVSAFDLAKRAELVTGATQSYTSAGFAVRPEHKLRFLKASASEANGNNNPANGDYAAFQRNLANSDTRR